MDMYYFELVYKLIRKQNEFLIQEIAKNEGLSYRELQALLPSKRALKSFVYGKEPVGQCAQ